MKEYLIGLDIGTGSIKALAVDTKGTVISSSQQSYPLIQSDDETCEQDPHAILQAFIASIKAITSQLQYDPLAVSLSSAMHSILLMDGSKPITNLITWADNRARLVASRVHRSSSAEMLYEQTGTPIHAMTPLCKLIWFRENQEELFRRATKFISIKEFIWYNLHNTFEVDYSIASASGLFDIESLQWNQNALSLAEISPEQLSKPVDTNHLRRGLTKDLANKMGLSPSVPFIIGSSDGCMANLGTFATQPGIAALTIGTSGAVRVATSKPVHNFSAMTFNYRLDAETYIAGGPTNNGGVVLKWYAQNFLRNSLKTADDYAALLSKVDTIEAGADGLIFLPYILGERAPIWNSHACGAFYGIRSTHTQEHFTRAVLEGISMALYSIAENMERGGLSIKQVNASGGFIHSAQWLQIMANIFGKKICLVNTSDASALGAAYLGLKTLGMIENYDQLNALNTKEILPDKRAFEQYQKKYKLFQELYMKLESMMTPENY